MNQQVMRAQEVCALLGVSRATLYRMMDKGAFPRPVSLSDRTVGWSAVVVHAWLSNRSQGLSCGREEVKAWSSEVRKLGVPGVLELKPCIDVVKFAFMQDGKPEPIGRKITDYPGHARARMQVGRCVNLPMSVSYLELAMDVWGEREQALRFIADMLINHAAIMSDTPVRAISLLSRTATGLPVFEKSFLSTAEHVIASLLAGATIYAGNQRNSERHCNQISPFSLRLYWKCTDRQKNGLAKPLPAHEHRARFEVCILGEALAEIGLDRVKDWAGWEAWRLTAATKLFAQRLPIKCRVLGVSQLILSGAARRQMTPKEVSGYRASMLKKTGKDIKPRKHLSPADTKLNTRLRNALKRLDRALRVVDGA